MTLPLASAAGCFKHVIKLAATSFPLPKNFLRQMLGVQRTTVSEAVSKLQAAGLIDTQYGQIQIIDRTGLKREACECYEIVRKHADRLLDKRKVGAR
jgi:Mn-dependent DtxR family transcriptional regulator